MLQQLIGGTLVAVGTYKGLQAVREYDYDKLTSGARSLADLIPAALEGDLNKISNQYEADIAANRMGISNETTASLQARGIYSPEVSKASIKNQQVGLSGAYAAAHDALTRARANASTKLDVVMAQYYKGIAEKQIQAQIDKQALKAGIYGTLAGAGAAALMTYKPSQSTTTEQNIINSPSPSQRLEMANTDPLRYNRSSTAGIYR